MAYDEGVEPPLLRQEHQPAGDRDGQGQDAPTFPSMNHTPCQTLLVYLFHNMPLRQRRAVLRWMRHSFYAEHYVES